MDQETEQIEPIEKEKMLQYNTNNKKSDENTKYKKYRNNILWCVVLWYVIKTCHFAFNYSNVALALTCASNF